MSKIVKLTAIFLIFLFPVDIFAQESANKVIKAEKLWKGSAEGGSTIVRGNTHQESTYGKGNVEYKKDKLTNLFKTRLENTKTNKVRVKERYDLNNRLRHNYNKKDFALFEIEYVDDRYGGYDYRVSESLGYGRNFVDNEGFSVSGRTSIGSRQSKFIDGDREESLLVRIGGDLDWKIKEGVEFKQHIDISFDQDTEITRSDTSVKIRMKSISDSLYFTLSYFLERKSNVPSPEIKNTDSTLMLMFGYDF